MTARVKLTTANESTQKAHIAERCTAMHRYFTSYRWLPGPFGTRFLELFHSLRSFTNGAQKCQTDLARYFIICQTNLFNFPGYHAMVRATLLQFGPNEFHHYWVILLHIEYEPEMDPLTGNLLANFHESSISKSDPKNLIKLNLQSNK